MKPLQLELTVRNHPGVLCHVTNLIWRKRLSLESCHFPASSEDRRLLYLTFSPEESSEKVLRNLGTLYDVLLARERTEDGNEAPPLVE